MARTKKTAKASAKRSGRRAAKRRVRKKSAALASVRKTARKRRKKTPAARRARRPAASAGAKARRPARRAAARKATRKKALGTVVAAGGRMYGEGKADEEYREGLLEYSETDDAEALAREVADEFESDLPESAEEDVGETERRGAEEEPEW